MIELNKIINLAIDEINKQLPSGKKVNKDTDIEIFGPKSNFDSMALINFVLIIEGELKKKKIDNKNILNFLMDKMTSIQSYKISDFKNDIKNLLNLDEKRN